MKPRIETEAIYKIAVIIEYIAIFLKCLWIQVQKVQILCGMLLIKQNHSMK